MTEQVALNLWCQLAFRVNLTQDQLKLRDSCAKLLLELTGVEHESELSVSNLSS